MNFQIKIRIPMPYSSEFLLSAGNLILVLGCCPLIQMFLSMPKMFSMRGSERVGIRKNKSDEPSLAFHGIICGS